MKLAYRMTYIQDLNVERCYAMLKLYHSVARIANKFTYVSQTCDLDLSVLT